MKGKPLNLTGITFGPDGAMYFTVGGRGTQSAIYRVRWTGEKAVLESKATDPDAKLYESARTKRRNLEQKDDKWKSACGEDCGATRPRTDNKLSEVKEVIHEHRR